MSKMKLAAITMSLFMGLAVIVPVPQAAAQSPAEQIQKGVDQVGGKEAGASQPVESVVKTAVNVMLFLIGAVAVIMLVYGGIRYVLSGGDASAVTAAKNTILYAVVGIIVAILAYAVVEFVVDTL